MAKKKTYIHYYKLPGRTLGERSGSPARRDIHGANKGKTLETRGYRAGKDRYGPTGTPPVRRAEQTDFDKAAKKVWKRRGKKR